MSYSISEHKNEFYIHVRFFSLIDDEILMEYFDEVFVIPEFRSKYLLVDYSEVTVFKFTAPGVFTFCNKLNDGFEAWQRQKGRKVAILAPENIVVLAGLTGRVFVQELLSLEHAPHHKFFQSKADALEWLGLTNGDLS